MSQTLQQNKTKVGHSYEPMNFIPEPEYPAILSFSISELQNFHPKLGMNLLKLALED